MTSADQFVGGSYSHVKRARTDDAHVIVPIPPLLVFFSHLEKKKGSELTEEEVIAARDDAPCISMKAEDRDELAESRGYTDIDPENAWLEWQNFRAASDANSELTEPEIDQMKPANVGPPRWLVTAIVSKLVLATSIVAAVVWWASR